MVAANLPATSEAARAEQKRVLGQSKSVAQIRTEWEAIEAKRPGGNFDAALLPLKLNRARTTEREQHLIDVIETLHNTVRGYHAEMGILLEAQAEREAALERARGLLRDAERALVPYMQIVPGTSILNEAAQVHDRIRAALATAPAGGE